MLRRFTLVLAALILVVVGAAIYAHGPIVSEYVVFIELPELVEEMAAQADANVTNVRTAVSASVPLSASTRSKLVLKRTLARIGLGMAQVEYAETYVLATSAPNLSVSCTFRGLGDQVIGIALQQHGAGEQLLRRVEAALTQRLPAYEISVLPANTLLERTRDR